MRTETLAVVFTDIKGYTAATSSQSHQENAMMLKRVARLIEPVVRAYNGRVIKSIGDAYMIVFRSPTDAVACAAAIQDRLHQHNTNSSAEQSIHLRVAMNIGEVRVHKGDIFGEPVNIAARIETVTPADEIYLSQAVFLTMNRSDLPTERVGEFELKGIPEAVTVYRVRKFAHLEEEIEDDEVTAPSKAAGLPFGGTQLDHWRRVRWLRRAFHAMWLLAAVGMVAAAYLRYRPPADYNDVVEAAKDAVKEQKPMAALALAGEIPATAVQERVLVRRHRRDAAKLLIENGKPEAAATEIARLLQEDERDAEALVLKGVLLVRQPDRGRTAMIALRQALELHEGLAGSPTVISAIVEGYIYAGARNAADILVDAFLRENAVPALLKLLEDHKCERLCRATASERLKKLDAGDQVDWVALYIDDLKTTNCGAREWAIKKLREAGDERAVGPLLRLARTRGCGWRASRRAADAIMGR